MQGWATKGGDHDTLPMVCWYRCLEGSVGYCPATEGRSSYPHDEPGLAHVVERLRASPGALIVLKRPVVSSCPSAGARRGGAACRGRQSSTGAGLCQGDGEAGQDRSPRRAESRPFADVIRPVPGRCRMNRCKALAALLARRRQLIEMLTAEKKPSRSAPHLVHKRLHAHITWLDVR